MVTEGEESQVAPLHSHGELPGSRNFRSVKGLDAPSGGSNLNSVSSCKQLLLHAWQRPATLRPGSHTREHEASSQLGLLTRSGTALQTAEPALTEKAEAPGRQLQVRPLQSSSGTLESVHPALHDSKRGVYQKIVDLQSQQRRGSTRPNEQERDSHVPARPNPPVLHTRVLPRAHGHLGAKLDRNGGLGFAAAAMACTVLASSGPKSLSPVGGIDGRAQALSQ